MYMQLVCVEFLKGMMNKICGHDRTTCAILQLQGLSLSLPLSLSVYLPVSFSLSQCLRLCLFVCLLFSCVLGIVGLNLPSVTEVTGFSLLLSFVLNRMLVPCNLWRPSTLADHAGIFNSCSDGNSLVPIFNCYGRHQNHLPKSQLPGSQNTLSMAA